MRHSTTKSVDAYIAAAPAPARRLMKELRRIIRAAAPRAEEKISYRMPMFMYHGMLVGFAAFDHHVGLYALSTGIRKHARELKGYKTGKGSIQFPLDARLPVRLVRTLVRERVAENEAKAARKGRAPH